MFIDIEKLFVFSVENIREYWYLFIFNRNLANLEVFFICWYIFGGHIFCHLLILFKNIIFDYAHKNSWVLFKANCNWHFISCFKVMSWEQGQDILLYHQSPFVKASKFNTFAVLLLDRHSKFKFLQFSIDCKVFLSQKPVQSTHDTCVSLPLIWNGSLAFHCLSWFGFVLTVFHMITIRPYIFGKKVIKTDVTSAHNINKYMMLVCPILMMPVLIIWLKWCHSFFHCRGTFSLFIYIRAYFEPL